MGTAWVLAAMAAAVGAFIFGRGRAEPVARDEARAYPPELLEGLAPGDFDDDTQPAVADPAHRERLSRSA